MLRNIKKSLTQNEQIVLPHGNNFGSTSLLLHCWFESKNILKNNKFLFHITCVAILIYYKLLKN